MDYNNLKGGRDSSVGIATRYGLDGQGIESQWRRDFPHPSRPALRPTQPPVQWVPGLSRGVKRPERGVDHPPSTKRRGHKRVGLYLYSPSGTQWPVIGRTEPNGCVLEWGQGTQMCNMNLPCAESKHKRCELKGPTSILCRPQIVSRTTDLSTVPLPHSKRNKKEMI